MELTCCKCLKNIPLRDILKIKIGGLGYGSLFDNLETEVHLCRECLEDTPLSWWSLDVEEDDVYGSQRYKFEEDIMEYLESLSPEGREIVFNKLNKNPTILLDKETWIRYDKGEMSEEEQRRYGLIY